MGYTKYGEFMRIQRVKHHEVMGDLAHVLGAAPSFVSAVENGKKNVPGEWIDIIIDHYDLDEDEKSELLHAIEESRTQIKVNLTETTQNKRHMALQFARSFDNMDEETAMRIIKLLNGSDD